MILTKGEYYLTVFLACYSSTVSDVRNVYILIAQQANNGTTATFISNYVKILLHKHAFGSLAPILHRSLKIVREKCRLSYQIVQVVSQKLRTAMSTMSVKYSKELHSFVLNAASNLLSRFQIQHYADPILVILSNYTIMCVCSIGHKTLIVVLRVLI